MSLANLDGIVLVSRKIGLFSTAWRSEGLTVRFSQETRSCKNIFIFNFQCAGYAILEVSSHGAILIKLIKKLIKSMLSGFGEVFKNKVFEIKMFISPFHCGTGL